MSYEHNEKGVILQKIPYSDADEIITVLFEKSGVQKLFVRGSRKSRKRFAGRIDHFGEMSFQFTKKQQGLAVLQAIEDLPGVLRVQAFGNIFCYAFLNYFSELICEFFWENMHADDVYNLWKSLAEDLRNGGFAVPQAVDYTIRFLRLTGYDFADQDLSQSFLSDSVASMSTLDPKQKSKLRELFLYPQKILERRLKTLEFLLQVLR